MGRKRALESSSEDEDEDEPLLASVAGGSPKKGGSSGRKGGKTSPTGEEERGSNSVASAGVKEAEADFSGSDEEERFLRIMASHGTPTSSPSKAPASSTGPGSSSKVVKAQNEASTKPASRSLAMPGSSEETAGEKAELHKVQDLGSASAKAEAGGSKVKFSRSVELMVPNVKKISRGTFILQCEDPTFDVEGDSGVIGTLKSSEAALQLDIKGQLFEGSIVPCNTMMLVDLGASECRVEAVMNDFVQLKPIANPHGDDVDVEDSDYDLEPINSDDGEPAKKSKGGKSDAKKVGKKSVKKKPTKKVSSKKTPKKK
uniref:DNA-binding protein BIN4 n=1 Tax=Hemiselmis andersenii TaxID=464988 RepID=A0A6T8NSN5_HEMAN